MDLVVSMSSCVSINPVSCLNRAACAWPPEVDGWLPGVCALEKGQRTQYYERNEYDYGHKLLKIAEAFLGLR
jgi:hypothetical protein